MERRVFHIGINRDHHWEITEEKYITADKIPGKTDEDATRMARFRILNGQITHIFDMEVRDADIEDAARIPAAREVCTFKVCYAPKYETQAVFVDDFVGALRYVQRNLWSKK